MAPTAPSKRKSLRLKATERLANPLAPRKVHRPNSAVTDSFLSTKADKARIKHSSFVSRIGGGGGGDRGVEQEEPSSSSSTARRHTSHSRSTAASSSSSSSNRITKTSRKNAKRNLKRQNNLKSVALDALADALPELTAEERATGEAELKGRIRHKSLGSRPGALKKKERLVKGEMERFGMSLAQLSTVKEASGGLVSSAVVVENDMNMAGAEQQAAPAPPPPSTAANRFAALRGFIAATMEQNPAFSSRATGANAA